MNLAGKIKTLFHSLASIGTQHTTNVIVKEKIVATNLLALAMSLLPLIYMPHAILIGKPVVAFGLCIITLFLYLTNLLNHFGFNKLSRFYYIQISVVIIVASSLITGFSFSAHYFLFVVACLPFVLFHWEDWKTALISFSTIPTAYVLFIHPSNLPLVDFTNEFGTLDYLYYFNTCVVFVNMGGFLFYTSIKSERREALTNQAHNSLKESETAYRLLIDNMKTGLVLFDTDLRVTAINKTIKTIFEVTDADTLGRSVNEINIIEEPEYFLSHLKTALETGIEQRGVFRIKLSGKLRIFEVAFAAAHDGSGKTAGVQCLINDITKEFAIKKEKQRLQVQIAQSAKLASLGTLSAGVAHELNNPLAAVVGFNDILLRSADSSTKSSHYAGKIIKAALRMRRLIDHMAQFTKSTPKDYAFDFKVQDAVEDSLILLEEQLKNHGIKTEITFEDKLPRFYGDIIEIESVFQNLISNSRDAFCEQEFKKNRSIKLHTSHTGEEICFVYSDNAGGVREEVLDRIFDPFFTTKDVGKGTGIGMSIAMAVIKKHNGSMKAENTDVGARFTIKLPIKKAKP